MLNSFFQIITVMLLIIFFMIIPSITLGYITNEVFTDNIPEFFENTHFLKFGIIMLWFVLSFYVIIVIATPFYFAALLSR
jgi:hypothetical protein